MLAFARRLVTISSVLACALIASGPSAQAAFPGQNGKIAFAESVFNVGGPHGIWTVNPDGTGLTRITTASDTDPVWSPDGRRMALARGGGIWTVAADGSAASQVTSPVNQATDSSPTWSPDRRWIAFVRSPHWTTGQPPDIWTVGVDGSNPTRITNTPEREWHLAWSPDGGQIAFDAVDGDSIHSIRPDGTNRRTLIAPIQIFTGGMAGAGLPDWSPDGERMVFVRSYDCGGDGSTSIATANSDGTGEQIFGEICADAVYRGLPSWSPDGSRITFPDESTGLYTVNVDGSGRFRLTPQSSFENNPDWQPITGPQRTDYTNASQYCKALRDFLGDAEFGKGYRKHGKCVSANH